MFAIAYFYIYNDFLSTQDSRESSLIQSDNRNSKKEAHDTLKPPSHVQQMNTAKRSCKHKIPQSMHLNRSNTAKKVATGTNEVSSSSSKGTDTTPHKTLDKTRLGNETRADPRRNYPYKHKNRKPASDGTVQPNDDAKEGAYARRASKQIETNLTVQKTLQTAREKTPPVSSIII